VLTDLADFIADHRPHGPLTADATEPAWMATCSPSRARVEWYSGDGSLLKMQT
jgi:hypothetical protein